jgi:hypothetical protein
LTNKKPVDEFELDSVIVMMIKCVVCLVVKLVNKILKGIKGKEAWFINSIYSFVGIVNVGGNIPK